MFTHLSPSFPAKKRRKIIEGDKHENDAEIKAENQASATGAKIIEKYVQLAKENKIVFSDWIEGDDPAHLMRMLGYKSYQAQGIRGEGFVTCWIKEDIIKDGKYIKNQTIDHYTTVMQLAGLLIKKGHMDYVIDHHDGPDLSNGRIAWEYEHPGSHDVNELIEKKARALQTHEKVYFICTGANEEDLKKAVGADCVLKRGKQLDRFIEENF